MLAGCGSVVSYDDFAECLTDKGAVMYGSDLCSHCQDQKKMFGDSFEYINFVNCDFHEDECLEALAYKFPTWKLNDEFMGDLGVKTFDELSEATGCELPNE